MMFQQNDTRKSAFLEFCEKDGLSLIADTVSTIKDRR
jgi:hypothetical protein